MKARHAGGGRRAGRPVPGWWNVATAELRDLWLGGKALLLLLLFSVLLAIMVWNLASSTDIKLTPPKETVYLTLHAAITVGLFMSVVLAADSISGERERATLENLLLTPTSRHQIVLGKFLAALSPWPAALGMGAAYMAVLAPNGHVLAQNLAWGALLGSVLVVAFTGLGMVVSAYASSNRTSLGVTVVGYVLFFLPTQFPGTVQTGTAGRFVKGINPLESTNQFLEKLLVNNRSLAELAHWALAPGIFALVIVALLWRAAGRLTLEGGRGPSRRRRTTPALAVACLVLLVAAIPFATATRAVAAPSAVPLRLSIDTQRKSVRAGDVFRFATTVTNDGPSPAGNVLLAMNIVNNGDGEPVDPEDWSPQRTQKVRLLGPAASASRAWTIDPILPGDYVVYVVAVARPGSPDAPMTPATTPGLHLVVSSFTRLNPGGVLPLALGMPVGLGALSLLVVLARRRTVDRG